MGPAQARAQGLVVVDLAVDGQGVAVDRVQQRLGAVLHVHDGEPLVGQDGVAVAEDPAPVRAPVAQLLGHDQGLLAQFVGIGAGGVDAQDCQDAAHVLDPPPIQ